MFQGDCGGKVEVIDGHWVRRTDAFLAIQWMLYFLNLIQLLSAAQMVPDVWRIRHVPLFQALFYFILLAILQL